jgi:hypothetical protein
MTEDQHDLVIRYMITRAIAPDGIIHSKENPDDVL